MSVNHSRLAYILTLLTFFALAGCLSGNDGSGTSSSTTFSSAVTSMSGTTSSTTNTSTVTLTGVAAVGSPIAGGIVTAICAGGNALAAVTDSGGNWSLTLTDQSLPCALAVTGGMINGASNTTDYHSVAVSSGTANITPLTELMVANMSGEDPGTWFSGLASSTSTLKKINQEKVNTALENMSASLSGLEKLSTNNPITTAFTPVSGNVNDDMLTALSTALAASGENFASLKDKMSKGTAPSAALNASLKSAYASTESAGSKHTIGVSVSGLTGSGLLLQNNNKDDLAISQNGPATFATALASGSSYALTIVGQPDGQSCYIPSARGKVGNDGAHDIHVICRSAFSGYLYVGTRNDTVGKVKVFGIDPATGALTAVSECPTGGDYQPYKMYLTPNGKLLYLADSNLENGTISAYRRSSIDGSLTRIGNVYTTSFNVAPGVWSYPFTPQIAIDPTGNYFYLAKNTAKALFAFTINQANGSLSPINGSPYSSASFTTSLVVSPNGKFLYESVGSQGKNIYSIDKSSGALTMVMNVPPPDSAFYGDGYFDLTGKFFYVMDVANIARYTVNPDSGALSATSGNWFNVPQRSGCSACPKVAFSPNGRFFYALNSDGGPFATDSISSYSIDPSTGAINASAVSTLPTEHVALSMAMDPSGKFLYVDYWDGRRISIYAVDPGTGLLTYAGKTTVDMDVGSWMFTY